MNKQALPLVQGLVERGIQKLSSFTSGQHTISRAKAFLWVNETIFERAYSQ